MSNSISAKKELNVLIIDDNEQITKMISMFLKFNNHKCTVVNEGKFGHELLLKDEFDVILLDLAMPDIDGYEILEKINSHTIISKIIVLTASNITKENQKKFKALGIRTILQKPIDIDALLENMIAITSN